jgi:hypothetical protein
MITKEFTRQRTQMKEKEQSSRAIQVAIFSTAGQILSQMILPRQRNESNCKIVVHCMHGEQKRASHYTNTYIICPAQFLVNWIFYVLSHEGRCAV